MAPVLSQGEDLCERSAWKDFCIVIQATRSTRDFPKWRRRDKYVVDKQGRLLSKTNK